MELAGIVFVQVVMIFLLLAVGFASYKLKLVKDSGIKQITDILLFIVTPCLLINAYQKEFSYDLVEGLILSAGLSILIHIAAIVIATLCFPKEDTKRYRVNIFAAVYSNCGYMAIPLLSAALGTDGVFYGSAYLAVFTILYWTHGICVYKGDLSELSIKNIIKNPGIIGTVIALTLFISGIKLPQIVGGALGHLANLNTPLAMLVMGAYLAKTDFKKALSTLSVYAVTLLRLIIIPVIAVFLAKILPVSDIVAKSVIITAACPTAAVSTLLAARYDLDAGYSAELVAVSTVISVVTIPLVLMLY